MSTAFVALGSNLGDRAAHLARAVEGLALLAGTRVVRVSPWFETEAVGGPAGQGRYLNGVARLSTELAPRPLLRGLQALERAAGRERVPGARDLPRTLDLDLLLYDDLELDEPDLVVPHPRLEERLFVLEPLLAIEPAFVLPSGASLADRIARLRSSPLQPHTA